MNDQPAPSETDWRIRWQRRATWTVRELAILCCGGNPDDVKWRPVRDRLGDGRRPRVDTPFDRACWEVREDINRACEAGVIRIVSSHGHPFDKFRGDWPAFQPRDVAQWAATTFPDRWPFLPETFPPSDSEPVIQALRAGAQTQAPVTTAALPGATAEPVPVPDPNRPLRTRERTNLYRIIAALANKAKLPIGNPTTAAKQLASEISGGLSEQTIADHLKRAHDIASQEE